MEALDNKPVVCSRCFSDRGLQLDAERIGRQIDSPCPNCGVVGAKQLPLAGLEALTHRFFVWGSLWRARYGAAPLIQFNEHQKTSIDIAPWLFDDVKLIERKLGVGFFHYGPRLWMVGEVEPLKALQHKNSQEDILNRILAEYPIRTLDPVDTFYRIRVNPGVPGDAAHYDSPPSNLVGKGRFDSPGRPILYGSQDLEICVHECRISVEDLVFVATLAPVTSLRLLDLSVLLKEDDTTEFESLDIAVHMLFLAGKHSYRIARAIAEAARKAGFDGLVYPSYFSLFRLGQMPFQTVYGISNRRIPQLQQHEQDKGIPNLALFGRPIAEGKVTANCIDRLILSKVAYEFHFGPTGA